MEAGLKNNESLQTQIRQKRQEISDAEETLSDTKHQLKQAKKDLAAKQDELSSADWDLTALKDRQEQPPFRRPMTISRPAATATKA